LLFLTQELLQLLEDVPLAVQQTVSFMHDGAPAHFTSGMKQILDSLYPYQWIGWNRSVLSSLRLPDITPYDFCLWEHPKGTVYSNRVNTCDELCHLIQIAVTTI
jgi:hypothetical protein